MILSINIDPSEFIQAGAILSTLLQAANKIQPPASSTQSTEVEQPTSVTEDWTAANQRLGKRNLELENQIKDMTQQIESITKQLAEKEEKLRE